MCALLTLLPTGQYLCFLSTANIFQNQRFRKEYFLKKNKNQRVSNNLDPDQARRFVGPDLGPNRLQILLTNDNSKCM